MLLYSMSENRYPKYQFAVQRPNNLGMAVTYLIVVIRANIKRLCHSHRRGPGTKEKCVVMSGRTCTTLALQNVLHGHRSRSEAADAVFADTLIKSKCGRDRLLTGNPIYKFFSRRLTDKMSSIAVVIYRPSRRDCGVALNSTCKKKKKKKA